MNPAERAVRAVDGFQQRHGWLGFPFAVVKKFGDDRAGALAALLTYYGFFSLFPLLLILVTVLGFFLGRNSGFEERILRSALSQFPVIGPEIRVRALRASGVGLAVGLAGLLWGVRGFTDNAQHAMAQVWNVPGVVRPNFWIRLARGARIIGLLGLGIAVTTVLAGLATVTGKSDAYRAVNVALSATADIGLFLLAFRVLTGPRIRWRDHIPGAFVAGVAWAVLQIVGGYLVSHNLRRATQVYSVFAAVIGLLSWIYLSAQVALYAAELNVVRARRLWPRSIVQPPLTEPDERVLAALAKQEERRPEESVHVQFEETAGGDDG